MYTRAPVGDNNALLRNRLYHLQDAAADNVVDPSDPGDQGVTDLAYDLSAFTPGLTINGGANNYRYDPLGNLIADKRERIDLVKWTVAGKVASVTHTAASGLKNLVFGYGADARRIRKEVRTSEGALLMRTWYLRDAQGNIMATYEHDGTSSLRLTERHLYGSEHLGLVTGGVANLYGLTSLIAKSQATPAAGKFFYELKDHLGNVAVVITADRFGVDQDGNGSVDFYVPKVTEYHGYEPFGSLLPGRNYSSSNYRFGFNGKENDNEVHGATGTFQDYGFRMYDTRLARFISMDPLTREYPHYSPYIFAGASPIAFIDFDGLERVAAITFNGDVNYRADRLELMNADEITRKTLTTNPAGQMVEAFREASTADVNGIGFVAIWGHGTRNDQWGTASNSSNMVIDDLDQLETAVANGEIQFAPNATIYIGNCNAGTLDDQGNSFAQRMADITGARVIAGSTDSYGDRAHAGSVGVKDETNGNMQYTMWSPKLDNFRLYERGGQPTDLGGTIDLAPMLERAKTMPVERMESRPVNLDRTTERTPVGR